MSKPLRDRSCAPVAAGTPPLAAARRSEFLEQLPDWEIVDGRLTRTWRFPDFLSALAFVNRLAPVAEAEGHHPDLFLTWGTVRVELWTHDIGGLSESDFILAAKLPDPSPAVG